MEYRDKLHYIMSRKVVRLIMMCLLGITLLSSCSNSFIFDDEGDCEKHYYVRYVFDMNMNFADAFASKVSSVYLYIFDKETGDLVKIYKESGEKLKQPGYRMEVDVDPGAYELIAWCGLENNDDLFTLPEQISNREHAHCTLAREYNHEGRAVQNKWLPTLFHGKEAVEFPDIQEGVYEVVIPLIKDTNNINLSMQHVGGQTLTSDMFTVTMTDGNGHLSHDNSVLEDEEIDYYPWHVADGNVDLTPTRDGEDLLNFFRAEISTSRLMADRDPRINIVDNATGNVVYSIPIVKWALELRSEQHSYMGNQEYLDREDEYNIMLYLDNKDERGWIAASIFINGWRLVDHEGTDM